MLDRRARGEVRSPTGQNELFRQRKDGLYLSGLVGDDAGGFSGPEETCRDRSPSQRLPKWQNHRRIPVYLCRCHANPDGPSISKKGFNNNLVRLGNHVLCTWSESEGFAGRGSPANPKFELFPQHREEEKQMRRLRSYHMRYGTANITLFGCQNIGSVFWTVWWVMRSTIASRFSVAAWDAKLWS